MLFEVGQNGIILTARPRAVSRGILRRPEAGLGNESVTMHCIWNTACRTMHTLCCISLTSYRQSCSKSREGPLALLQCRFVEKLAEILLVFLTSISIRNQEYAIGICSNVMQIAQCTLPTGMGEVNFIINQDPNIGKTIQSRLWIITIGTEGLSLEVCLWITFPAHQSNMLGLQTVLLVSAVALHQRPPILGGVMKVSRGRAKCLSRGKPL